jgi:carboxylesterase type B
MIYGQSAGAISVAQHLIYEKSIPLFKSIVMHSNPLTIACKDSWEAGIQANYFAKDIGCPTLNLKCMREKTADEVRTAQS